MRIIEVRRVYSYELQGEIQHRFNVDKLGYEAQQLLEYLCDEGLYRRRYDKNEAKLRITFVPFLLCVFLIIIFGALKWLFVGNSTFSEKSLIIKNMIRWDRYCKFNIV